MSDERKLYLVRWPLGCISLVTARNEDDLFDRLDEDNDPSECRWVEYDGPLWVDFTLPQRPHNERDEQPNDEGITMPAYDVGAIVDDWPDCIRLSVPGTSTAEEMVDELASWGWPNTHGIMSDAAAEESDVDLEEVATEVRGDVELHVPSPRAQAALERWYANLYSENPRHPRAASEPPAPAPAPKPRAQNAAPRTPIARPTPVRDRSSVVYFLRGENDGLVKIGTTCDLAGRLKSIRAMSAARVELLATVPGDHVLEKSFHERFAAHRRHGEWFHPAPELLAFVEELRWGTR